MIIGRSLKHTGGRVYPEVGSERERLRLFDQEGFPPLLGLRAHRNACDFAVAERYQIKEEF